MMMKMIAATLTGVILSMSACTAPENGATETTADVTDHDTDRLRHRSLSPRHAKWLGSTQSGPSR